MNLTPEQYTFTSRIDQVKNQVAGLNIAFANEIYGLITTGDIQANLDAMGNRAAEHLGYYAAMHGFLSALGQADRITAPDPAVYVANPDGTVIFTAPSEPEPSE